MLAAASHASALINNFQELAQHSSRAESDRQNNNIGPVFIPEWMKRQSSGIFLLGKSPKRLTKADRTEKWQIFLLELALGRF